MNGRGRTRDRPVGAAAAPTQAGEPGGGGGRGRGPGKEKQGNETRTDGRTGRVGPSNASGARREAGQEGGAHLPAPSRHHRVAVARVAEGEHAHSRGARGDDDTDRGSGVQRGAKRRDLQAPVHRGPGRASPDRSAHIAKADGGLAPLGVAALQDRIPQRAGVEGLNARSGQASLGFSDACRAGRSRHDALDALSVGIVRKKVKFVLEADIRDFVGRLDGGWRGRCAAASGREERAAAAQVEARRG